MKIAIARCTLLACFLTALATPARAQEKILIRMGTLAPQGTPWHDVLLQVREDWRKISGGSVEMRIYSGFLGDESEMILKMRVNQLQAVAVSGAALPRIDNGIACLQIPLMIESYEELDYVVERIAPRLAVSLCGTRDAVHEALCPTGTAAQQAHLCVVHHRWPVHRVRPRTSPGSAIAHEAIDARAPYPLEPAMTVSRRTFLKYTAGGTTLTLFGFNPKFGVRQAVAQIPGGTLDPVNVPKFATPLLVPPVMPTAGTIVQRGGRNVDYYEISVRQFAQQILPAGLPATTVWGYGAVTAADVVRFTPNCRRPSAICWS